MSVFQLLDLSGLLFSRGSVSLWYQRQCCTMSAFRPFLTSEQKRQGPKNERERGRESEGLAIWRLIISGLTEIGHEAHPAVDTQTCEDTHTHTQTRTLYFPVGGVQAGLLGLSEKQNTTTSQENKEKQCFRNFSNQGDPFLPLGTSPCIW